MKVKLSDIKIPVGSITVSHKSKRERVRQPKTPIKLRANGVAGGKALLAGRRGKISYEKLSEILDKRYRLFSDAESRLLRLSASEKSVLASAFVNLDGKNQRALNLSVQLVISPVINNKLGSNAPATVKAKGFDRVGVATGSFIKGIKGVFEK